MVIEQLCANPCCPHTFEPTRAWQRYCTKECRWQDWIRRHAEGGITHYTRPRRASRDGTGTRLYLTREELIVIAGGFGKGTPTSLLHKVRRAHERLNERTA